MLHKTSTTQTADEVLYLAFRAAFVSVSEHLTSEFQNDAPGRFSGFLEQIPLLRGTATQVQLELLLQTWSKISTAGPQQLSPLDQCVCYCAANELAVFGESENRHLIERAAKGPRNLKDLDFLWLASKLRTMQITWPFPVDSAVLLRDSHFLSPDLDRCEKRSQARGAISQLLEVVGTWMVTPNLLSNAEGLLTADEIRKLGCFFQENPRLMNL